MRPSERHPSVVGGSLGGGAADRVLAALGIRAVLGPAHEIVGLAGARQCDPEGLPLSRQDASSVRIAVAVDLGREERGVEL